MSAHPTGPRFAFTSWINGPVIFLWVKMSDEIQERTSGRKKGTPNKRTAELEAILEDRQFDLVDEFIFVYREAKRLYLEEAANRQSAQLENERKQQEDPDFTPDDLPRINAIWLQLAGDQLKNLFPYKFPKRKTVEVKVDEEDKKGLVLAYADPKTMVPNES